MGKSVLIVEDDEAIRSLMVELLSGEGYPVHSAQNGRVALNWLIDPGNELPGLIALDLYMPIMDGREFLAEVLNASARDLARIPVVLITASDPQGRLDLEGKTAAVLRKPIDIGTFLALVATHCGSL